MTSRPQSLRRRGRDVSRHTSLATACVMLVSATLAMVLAPTSGLTQQRSERVPADFLLALSHGSCEGRCPVFTIRLNARGRLDWLGERDVGLVGNATRSVPMSIVADIVRRLDEADVMGLASPLPMCVDTPTVTLQLSLRGQRYRIRHESCWAEKTDDGRRHDAMIRDIERLLDVARWRDRSRARGGPGLR